MRKLSRWIFVIVLLTFVLGCNPIQEIREAREAAEATNKETRMILEKIKGYAKKAEAASQKAVGTFEKQLKK